MGLGLDRNWPSGPIPDNRPSANRIGRINRICRMDFGLLHGLRCADMDRFGPKIMTQQYPMVTDPLILILLIYINMLVAAECLVFCQYFFSFSSFFTLSQETKYWQFDKQDMNETSHRTHHTTCPHSPLPIPLHTCLYTFLYLFFLDFVKGYHPQPLTSSTYLSLVSQDHFPLITSPLLHFLFFTQKSFRSFF
jgi:hypothetical protein